MIPGTAEFASLSPVAPRSDAPVGVDELYRAQAASCGRLAFLLTDDAEVAQELVQEAFARVLSRWPRIRDPLALKSYLRRTIVNLAIKGYRRRESERAYLRRWRAADVQHSTLPDLETREQLIDVLRSLPPRQRAVVVLRYYEDLPEKDIAEALGCPIGTVKSSLSRALTAMKVVLEEVADERG